MSFNKNTAKRKQMSPLQLTIILIVVIFVVLLIFPIFISNHISIEASENIKAPAKVVFGQINNLHNQKRWYPFRNDSVTPDSIPGSGQGVGAQRMWMKGDTVLRSLEIRKSEPFRYVDAVLKFNGKPGATEQWILSKEGVETKIIWKFHVLNLHYPFGRWLGFIIKYSMKPAMETGLKRMKKVSESEAKPVPDN